MYTSCGDTNVTAHESKCEECDYQEYLIIKRQAYIWRKTLKYATGTSHQPITSRKDRHAMRMSRNTHYRSCTQKWQPYMVTKSPKDSFRARTPTRFTNPECQESECHVRTTPPRQTKVLENQGHSQQTTQPMRSSAQGSQHHQC